MSSSSLVLSCIAMLASAGHGQFRPDIGIPQRPYVDLPIQPGAEAFLRKQLFKSNETKQIQDLLNFIKGSKDLDLQKLNPENVPGFDFNDPAIREKLKGLIGPNGPKLDPQKLLEIKKLIEHRIQDLKENGPAKVDADPNEARPNVQAGGDPPPDRDAAKWMKDIVQQVEDGRWGDLIKDSPALQKAVAEIGTNWKGKGFDPGKLDWLQKFKLDQGKLADWRPRIGNLPRIDVPRPRVNLDCLPRLPIFGFGRPRFAGGPPYPSTWTLLGWLPLLLVGVVVVVLACRHRARLLSWLFPDRWGGRSGAAAMSSLDSNRPFSRDDFLRAFEQLALLKLGPQVRSWNHIAVSRDLETTTGQADACRSLARLYEQARYTPLESPLSDDDRAEATRLIAKAAGAPAA
ncbi:MAG: hypothetical protein U0744_05445 [Gemmataceae bacterium]